MMRSRQFILRFLLALAVGTGSGGMLHAEPSSERTIVTATADDVLDRILVRWKQVEGTQKRFTHYEVRRREAGASSLTPLNPQPIGPLNTVAAIEALFTDPDLADALAGIQDTFGPDYASDLLALQDPGASEDQMAQLLWLPDQNYGAALALGLGWMDDTVLPGTGYVYEVWGLDSEGFPEERLGRVTAATGVPPAISAPTDATCVDPGDERAHLAAFLRWEEDAAAREEYLAGYDVLRVQRDPGGTCPPIGEGLPGVVQANRFPAMRDSHGRPREGEKLFAQHCVSCHPGGRDDTMTDNVAGTTLEQFRRRQYPELWAPSQSAQIVHDTNDLNALGPESLEMIYDWIEEFHFRDNGETTPGDPLVEGETYCYQVLPQNLLGRPGPPSPTVECEIRDMEGPGVPYAMQAQRIDQGSYETCEISWDRNDDPGDDTVHYELMRTTSVPKLLSELEPPVGPPPGWPVIVPHPPAGARVTHDDVSQTIVDAGQPFYYAAQAVDEAGNRSGFSGWVPCVPRDLVAPTDDTITLNCCDAGGNCDYRDDPAWLAEGEPTFLADPRDCPVEVDFPTGGDTFGMRLYRSFDGVNFLPEKDCSEPPCPLDFKPSVDQKMWVKAKPFDKSFNLGSFTNTVSYLYFGAPLPPPRIISVALVDEVSGRVEIRFRSLKPTALLGFALYKEHADAPGFQLVVRHADETLSSVQSSPGHWTPLPGAQPLSTIPGFIGPPAPAPQDFLYFDDLDGVYVLDTVLGETSDVTLKLVAIGHSGKEGHFIPYIWDGWQPGDGFLDWPEFRDGNYLFQLPALSATYDISNGWIDLSWSPSCADHTSRPFVVYRKRGSATRWQQISPPFICDSSSQTNLTYRDRDVEPGFDYTYTVLRTNPEGEFTKQFGPETETVP